MAFKLGAHNLVKEPVTIPTRDEGGKETEAKFFLIIEPIPRSERKKLDREIRRSVTQKLNGLYSDGKPKDAAQIDEALEELDKREEAQERELFKRVKGWEDVEDQETGDEVPFSDEAFRAACEWDVFYRAAWEAVDRVSRGAGRKN